MALVCTPTSMGAPHRLRYFREALAPHRPARRRRLHDRIADPRLVPGRRSVTTRVAERRRPPRVEDDETRAFGRQLQTEGNRTMKRTGLTEDLARRRRRSDRARRGDGRPPRRRPNTMKIAHLLPPSRTRAISARNKVGEVLHARRPLRHPGPGVPVGTSSAGSPRSTRASSSARSEMSVQPAAYMAPITMLSAILDFPFFWPTDTERLLRDPQEPGHGDAGRGLRGAQSPSCSTSGTPASCSGRRTSRLNNLDAFNAKIARVMPSALMTERQQLFRPQPRNDAVLGDLFRRSRPAPSRRRRTRSRPPST